jgi:hypothetical protein
LLRSLSRQQDPPVDSIQDVSNYCFLYLRKHHREIVLNKHVKAEEVRLMMDTFSNNARHSLFRRRCQTALADLHGRLSATRGDRAGLAGDTAARLTDFETAAKERVDEMRRRHDAERARHANEHPTVVPTKFRRRSPQLLEMFRQERRLFFQSRFDEAAALRRECDERDRAEEAECRARALRHWEVVGSQMDERHRREEETMQQRIALHRIEIEQDAANQEQAINRRDVLLGAEIEGTEGALRKSAPHAIMRSLLFDRTPARGTLFSVSDSEDIDKTYQALPQRAKEILLDLK